MLRKKYNHFLEDRDFIIWQLTGDRDLKAFWEEYLGQYPEEKEEFQKAIEKFSKVKLNREILSSSESDELLERINLSVGKAIKKRRVFNLIKYSAACIVIMAFVSFYFLNYHGKEKMSFLTENIIVGENLEDENIYLITTKESIPFQSDVNIQVDESGTVVAEEVGGRKTEVTETTDTEMNKLVVPYGKRSQIILADGTKVWLNSGSVLQFPTAFAGGRRTVSLTGEMYIEVAGDSKMPFIINTRNMQIKVYGTKFNISAYQEENSSSVVLVEGSVGVRTHLIKEEIKLAPNDMLSLYEDGLEKKQVDISSFVSWKDGYLILDSTPMTEILKQVGRYYNITFNIPDKTAFNQLSCTGKIYLSKDLDNVMKTVSLLSDTNFKRENKTIYISMNNGNQ